MRRAGYRVPYGSQSRTYAQVHAMICNTVTLVSRQRKMLSTSPDEIPGLSQTLIKI